MPLTEFTGSAQQEVASTECLHSANLREDCFHVSAEHLPLILTWPGTLEDICTSVSVCKDRERKSLSGISALLNLCMHGRKKEFVCLLLCGNKSMSPSLLSTVIYSRGCLICPCLFIISVQLALFKGKPCAPFQTDNMNDWHWLLAGLSGKSWIKCQTAER